MIVGLLGAVAAASWLVSWSMEEPVPPDDQPMHDAAPHRPPPDAPPPRTVRRARCAYLTPMKVADGSAHVAMSIQAAGIGFPDHPTLPAAGAITCVFQSLAVGATEPRLGIEIRGANVTALPEQRRIVEGNELAETVVSSIYDDGWARKLRGYNETLSYDADAQHRKQACAEAGALSPPDPTLLGDRASKLVAEYLATGEPPEARADDAGVFNITPDYLHWIASACGFPETLPDARPR